MKFNNHPELEIIMNRYFYYNENGVWFHKEDLKSKKSLENVSKFFSDLVAFERPDMYSKVNNELLLLEHFEFNSSSTIRKAGSLQRNEEARIGKEFNKSKYVSSEDKLFHDEIRMKPSLENYKSNFIKNFENHYNKIPEYIEHLQKDGLLKDEEYYTAFFIEDTSALGSYYLDKASEMKIIVPIYTNFFWDEIKTHNENLDYIFFGFYNGHKYDTYFIDIKSDYNYSSHLLELTEDNFLDLEPKVMGASISVTANKNGQGKKQ